MGKVHKYLFYTVLGLISLLYFPRIADYGLFMDGSIYGTIAHNMAIGEGSFWAPIFNNHFALKPVESRFFYEHPPLMFWMQSWFFRVLGDGFYVENIYGTVILILHILSLTWFFRYLTERKYSIFSVWLVLLLWYMVSSVLWSFPQNMIDNTLSLWSLWSVMMAYVAMRRDHFLWAVMAGLLMGLGVLTKGPLGLFPLAVFGLYWLVSALILPKGERYSFFQAFYKTVAFLFGFLIVGLNVYINPKGRAFMLKYLNQQVIPSVAGQREMQNTMGEHLSIFRDMLVELAPIYVVAILLGVFLRKRQILSAQQKVNSFWMLLVGLSATLPIALSAKSHSFYLISGVPYFAMAVVLYWAEGLNGWLDGMILRKLKRTVWLGLIASVFVFTLFSTVSQWGAYKRDRGAFLDMDLLSQKLPNLQKIGIDPELVKDATLNSNLERFLWIHETPDWEKEKVILVATSSDTISVDLLSQKGYKLLEGDWQVFRVFVRK